VLNLVTFVTFINKYCVTVTVCYLLTHFRDCYNSADNFINVNAQLLLTFFLNLSNTVCWSFAYGPCWVFFGFIRPYLAYQSQKDDDRFLQQQQQHQVTTCFAIGRCKH